MTDRFPARDRGWKILVALSFIPLLVKAVSYATLGAYVPLIVFCLFGWLVVWGLLRGSAAGARAIRAWASALVLWGLVRLGLSVMLHLTDIGEAHPVNQITAWYLLLSVGHLLLGIYLHRRCKQVMVFVRA